MACCCPCQLGDAAAPVVLLATWALALSNDINWPAYVWSSQYQLHALVSDRNSSPVAPQQFLCQMVTSFALHGLGVWSASYVRLHARCPVPGVWNIVSGQL